MDITPARPVANTNEYGFWQIDGRDMDWVSITCVIIAKLSDIHDSMTSN